MHKNIVLRNDTQDVPRLITFVDEASQMAGFSSEDIAKVRLAVEEVVVNVMNYAYPADTHGDVTVEASLYDTNLTFKIIDCGAPFDPTTLPDVDTTLPARERAIGGLGIHLVRQIMDTIQYDRMGSLNVLTLIINRKPNK